MLITLSKRSMQGGALFFIWAITISARAEPARLYLNFSDGNEPIQLGEEDDAPRNTSRLCETKEYGYWPGAADCGERIACRSIIADLVLEHLWKFDVEIYTARPSEPYNMVMIGPPTGSCAFAAAGLADVDCGNHINTNLAFVFDCNGAAADCAYIIAHEFGHTVGLDHVAESRDFMAVGRFPEQPEFLDAALQALPGHVCGARTQNSFEHLSLNVGLWPKERKRSRGWRPAETDEAGCNVTRASGDTPTPSLLSGLALLWIYRRRDKLRAIRSQG